MSIINRLRFILQDLEDIEVKDNSENAEAINALISVVNDLAKCLGDYITDNQ